MYNVYILASKRNGTLYIGLTDNLFRRVIEHKEKISKGFTNKYDVNRLVYFEQYKYINEAIYREKCLKKWKRLWKIELIEQNNKDWIDLTNQIALATEIEEMKIFVRKVYGKNIDENLYLKEIQKASKLSNLVSNLDNG